MPSARTRRRLERERSRRRRRTVAVTLSAGLLAVAAFAAWSTRDRPPPQRPRPDDVRAGSEEIEHRGELTISRSRLPSSYRIVYRVDDYAGADHQVTTDDVRVERPLESRIDRRRGEPPGDEVTFTQVATLGRLSVPRSGQTRASAVVGSPSLASGDFRFDIGLPAAIDTGMAEPREWREVEGRQCQVYRTGSPLGSGEMRPYDPDASEYADVCIDDRGFLLEELWVSDGRALRRKVAVRIELGEKIPAEMMEHSGTPPPPRLGGGSVREVEADSYPPGKSWFARKVPSGFEQEGRYTVVPAQPELVEEEQRARRRASVVDVWTRGIDLLILDQGGTIGGIRLFEPDPNAEKVDVEGFDEAEAIAGFRMNEIRIHLDRGRWIRIQGTLEFDELIEVAEGLEAVESETNELVYLDEEPPDEEIEAIPET